MQWQQQQSLSPQEISQLTLHRWTPLRLTPLKKAATQTAASASPTTSIGGTALTPPNVTGGYNTAAAEMKSGALESDVGYTSAFTRNEETGALEGAPTIAKGETFNTPQTTVAGQIEKVSAEDSKLNQMAQAEG